MEEKRKEFDRSVCYQHFEEFHEQIMRVKDMYGTEKAFSVYQAIAEYGLYQTEITDKELLILVGESVIRGIDRSQRKRSKSFSTGENMDMTRSVIEYYLDHPDASQNKIALVVGVSKGKVNKVLQNYKLGKYKDIDFNNNISDSNSHSSSISYSSVTDDRDRLTDHEEDADAERREIEEVLELYRKGFSYKKDNPQIQDKTGLSGQRIHYIINTYKDDKDYQHKKKVKGTSIPDINGNESGWNKEGIDIDKKDMPYLFNKFTDPNGEYKFNYNFVVDWFTELGWDGVIEEEAS